MTIKECPNCPGRDDHDAEHCPIKPQASGQGGGCSNCRLVFDSHKGYVTIPCSAHQPATSAAQSAPDEREAVLSAGNGLSNIAYNLAQLEGVPLPHYTCELLRMQREQWDKAVAAWQRAQSAPAGADERDILLAEARLVLSACLDDGELPSEISWMAERASKGRRIYTDDRALAAAPAQPAAQEPVAWTSRAKLKAMNDMGVASMWPKRIADGNDVPLYTHAPAAQDQGEVQRLREAVARADEVLAALTACTTPLDRLERKFGKDWCQSVDKIRSELIAALSASESQA